jgi:hypothetical protein
MSNTSGRIGNSLGQDPLPKLAIWRIAISLSFSDESPALSFAAPGHVRQFRAADEPNDSVAKAQRIGIARDQFISQGRYDPERRKTHRCAAVILPVGKGNHSRIEPLGQESPPKTVIDTDTPTTKVGAFRITATRVEHATHFASKCSRFTGIEAVKHPRGRLTIRLARYRSLQLSVSQRWIGIKHQNDTVRI